jgi:hypothetical protein
VLTPHDERSGRVCINRSVNMLTNSLEVCGGPSMVGFVESGRLELLRLGLLRVELLHPERPEHAIVALDDEAA